MIVVEEYRGHIRNWKELCGELGIALPMERAERELEILRKGYEAWGTALPDHLYGMFAFALWDEEAEMLYCARDQFGTKPFYYYQTEDGGLLYGTMIRDIMEKEGFVKELNESMLQIYLSLTYVAGEDTFFKGLKKLMPGHFLTWKHGELTIERYFAPEYHPDETKTVEELHCGLSWRYGFNDHGRQRLLNATLWASGCCLGRFCGRSSHIGAPN